MVSFKIKRVKRSDIIDLNKAVVEVIKDGEVVAMIYPTEEGIKISFESLISLEANNGVDMIPQTPTIFMKF